MFDKNLTERNFRSFERKNEISSRENGLKTRTGNENHFVMLGKPPDKQKTIDHGEFILCKICLERSFWKFSVSDFGVAAVVFFSNPLQNRLCVAVHSWNTLRDCPLVNIVGWNT